MTTHINDLLSPAELALVTHRSNWRGATIIAFDWLVIGATFILMAVFPNPLVLLAGVAILGTRQLGLGIVVHESGHRTLFSSNALNDFASKWLSGYWVFSDKDSYMRTHLKHHQTAGTSADPDLANYAAYPISRTSLRRKFTRDLTGRVGWRRLKSIHRALKRLPKLSPPTRQYLLRSLGVNALLLICLTSLGHGWLYLMWVIAFITSHMLVVRIRQIAEHAAVPDASSTDPRNHTRTLYISWLERLLIAPHQVHYHLEHHLMASVPIYRLATLHRLLLEKDYFEGMVFQRGYVNLLKTVSGDVAIKTKA
ncbi:MAG: fatty acid desaturase [Candidatus Azotimanducaceae bacterium]|jgi:fatty acid desaturase